MSANGFQPLLSLTVAVPIQRVHVTIERLNKEIKRRSGVMEIFPDPAAELESTPREHQATRDGERRTG